MTKLTKEQQAYERGYRDGFAAGRAEFEYRPVYRQTSWPATNAANPCNCAPKKRGQYSAGWVCPVHGQQF